MLAEYCPDHFDAHVRRCNAVLEGKLDTLIEALDEHFGTTIDYRKPPGGIFLWVRLPEGRHRPPRRRRGRAGRGREPRPGVVTGRGCRHLDPDLLRQPAAGDHPCRCREAGHHLSRGIRRAGDQRQRETLIPAAPAALTAAG